MSSCRSQPTQKYDVVCVQKIDLVKKIRYNIIKKIIHQKF